MDMTSICRSVRHNVGCRDVHWKILHGYNPTIGYCLKSESNSKSLIRNLTKIYNKLLFPITLNVSSSQIFRANMNIEQGTVLQGILQKVDFTICHKFWALNDSNFVCDLHVRQLVNWNLVRQSYCTINNCYNKRLINSVQGLHTVYTQGFHTVRVP